MEEKTDRTATKVEEQVALLTQTVAQLSFTIEYTTMLVSALLYNHLDMKVPNWNDHKEEFKKVEKLCEKIFEEHKKNGQRKTNKS